MRLKVEIEFFAESKLMQVLVHGLLAHSNVACGALSGVESLLLPALTVTLNDAVLEAAPRGH